jgi:hypothetical protein
VNSEVKPTKGRTKKQEEAHEKAVAKHPRKNSKKYAESSKAGDFVHEEVRRLDESPLHAFRNKICSFKCIFCVVIRWMFLLDASS